MCGISGIVDLRGGRDVERAVLEKMSAAIARRGPDDSGSHVEPRLGLASRRLRIVGLADGRQPIYNEDRSVVVVFNGELFDYPERRADLAARGHRFSTSTDTEVLVHAWEERGEAMIAELRGQFAFALFDRRRRVLILARDRLGIVPLHWAVRDETLYFGSEIKAVLASGNVPAAADPKGLDHVFTCLGLGTRRTAFQHINAVLPATYLKVDLTHTASASAVTEHTYWRLAFPEREDEYAQESETQLTTRFAELFDDAVRKRLRGDVAVVGYLSGGVDSSSVMASATRTLGRAPPCFTIRIPTPGLDETSRALSAATRLGVRPTITTCDRDALRDVYPQVTLAAEAPVLDLSAGALFRQAQEVRRQGFKVALTGEGADEALAGYPWFKTGKALGLLDAGRVSAGNVVRRVALLLGGESAHWPRLTHFQDQLGGPNGLLDFFSLLYIARSRLYSSRMLEQLGQSSAFDDLPTPRDHLRRLHPLNRALHLGYQTLLPGLLLSQKGDRPAMHNAVETRPPFLDEALVEFCARLPPHLKLRGLLRDKHVLRRYAANLLPAATANRRKAIFRAAFADTLLVQPPRFVDELLSDDSLRTTGYFDVANVRHARATYAQSRNPLVRLIREISLAGVVATQLWHHTFLGELCALPAWNADV